MKKKNTLKTNSRINAYHTFISASAVAKVFQPKLSSSTGTVNRTKSFQKVPKKSKSKLNNGRIIWTQNASIEYETDSSDSKEDHDNNHEAFKDSKEVLNDSKGQKGSVKGQDSLPFMDDDEEDYQDLYKHLTYETKASLTSIRTFSSVSGDDGPDPDPNPDPTLLTPSTSGLYRNRSTETKASLTSIKVSSVDGPDPYPNPDPTLVSPSTSGLYRNRSQSFDLNLPTPPTSFSYPGPFLKATTNLESTLQTSNQNKRIINLKTPEESSATCSPICTSSKPLTYPSKTLKSNQDIVSPNILSLPSAQVRREIFQNRGGQKSSFKSRDEHIQTWQKVTKKLVVAKKVIGERKKMKRMWKENYTGMCNRAIVLGSDFVF